MKTYKTVGLIGRFKPLHNGSASMLEKVCENAERVIIGIGSVNKYDLRNPLTAQESKEMIDSYLSSRFTNYEFRMINDHGHEEETSDGWKAELKDAMGTIDAFFSGNPYVKELLQDTYKIIDARDFSGYQEPPIKASMIRLEMAKGDGWKEYVPKEVAKYITTKGLDERFRKEFGKETLLKASNHAKYNGETLAEEMKNVRGR